MAMLSNRGNPFLRWARHATPWAGMGLCLVLLTGHLIYDRAGARPSLSANAAATVNEAENGADGGGAQRAVDGATLSWSESKVKEAGIAVAPVRADRVATELGVVGVIQANADQRVDVRPRAGGVVRSVHATLGQRVKKGDLLVVLDSPEIGTARLDLRSRQRALVNARYDADWKSEIAANVAELVPELRRQVVHRSADVKDEHEVEHTDRRRDDLQSIESRFVDKPLGAYRGTLLQALAEYDIAAHEEEKTTSLSNKQVLGVHPMIVAVHTRQGMQAKLEGAIEQVRFDSAQQKRLADQALKQAEAGVVDAGQRLRILGVPEDIRHMLEHPEEANDLPVDQDVTAYHIQAPFDGTIITKNAVPSQKADIGDVLFQVADLRTVWATAKVSESDLYKLPKIQGATFRATAAAYPGRNFSARLLSIGSAVDPQTRTVPIWAEADNPEGLLKIGMFVRILLDADDSRPALTVPSEAVVEIEGGQYVFVPDGGDQGAGRSRFQLKPVVAGRRLGDRVVVEAGLQEGDQVVAAGAFLLKSELLLQNTPDDD